jgi:hypothetical protein
VDFAESYVIERVTRKQSESDVWYKHREKDLTTSTFRKSRFTAEGERVDTSKSKNRVIKNAISKLI